MPHLDTEKFERDDWAVNNALGVYFDALEMELLDECDHDEDEQDDGAVFLGRSEDGHDDVSTFLGCDEDG